MELYPVHNNCLKNKSVRNMHPQKDIQQLAVQGKRHTHARRELILTIEPTMINHTLYY